MIFISHRGNINGPNPERENQIGYINEARDKGFDVEIDVWIVWGHFWLGHDEPQYKIEPHWLMARGLWCHAKNPEALFQLQRRNLHYFWHQEDDYTVTSKGYIWVHPKARLLRDSINVLPENRADTHEEFDDCYGVCSDYVEGFRE